MSEGVQQTVVTLIRNTIGSLSGTLAIVLKKILNGMGHQTLG